MYSVRSLGNINGLNKIINSCSGFVNDLM